MQRCAKLLQRFVVPLENLDLRRRANCKFDCSSTGWIELIVHRACECGVSGLAEFAGVASALRCAMHDAPQDAAEAAGARNSTQLKEAI
jgi:hypothetical protein